MSGSQSGRNRLSEHNFEGQRGEKNKGAIRSAKQHRGSKNVA